MAINVIDAAMLRRMFLAGAKRIDEKKEWINELNVFPVPDGDTGTNMTMTIMSAAHEIEQIAEPTMENLSRAISMGALRGARGNSGVILSQLFRGFTKEIKEVDQIDLTILAAALARATETAYKAVMKPKEGTILTVARGISQKAAEAALEYDDLAEAMAAVIAYGDAVLQKTPDLLPVLKEAGVVDSGGQGLLEILKGAYDCFTGKEEIEISVSKSGSGSETVTVREDIETANIKFGYCTEFIIMLEKDFTDETELEFKAYLSSIGDSIVCVHDEDIVKVHVHTNDPGFAIQKGLSYGSLTSMKIDNMREEHHEKLFKETKKLASEQATQDREWEAVRLAKEQEEQATLRQEADGRKGQAADGREGIETTVQPGQETVREGQTAQDQKAKEARQETSHMGDESASRAAEPHKEAGFIAVSVGDGLNEIFKGLGVDYMIEGGQTMNPSTEDFVEAAREVNADTIYILPNNKNIILAAEQARYLIEDKEVIIIPSETVPQGITALINYVVGETTEENLAHIIEEMKHIKSGELTYAVRDTSIGDKIIREGDIMGIGDGEILSVDRDIEAAALEMAAAMVDEDSELISIYYGADISEATAQVLADKLGEKYENCDVELQYGGQPIYYYIMSVE